MSNRIAPPGAARLAAAMRAAGILPGVNAGALVELRRTGLAHRHWRVRGQAALLRVPLSRDGAAFARQAETFRRMAASGHTPALLGLIEPSARLPTGALVVEHVAGRIPRVPHDLPAIARALAAIHELAVPRPAARPPLASPADPFGSTLASLERHLNAAAPTLDAAVRTALHQEAQWARRFAAAHASELAAAPRCLVLTDTHPRNFVIRRDGTAVAVDLEKALYGSPAIDLAHAILPGAIAWGRSGEAVTAADRRHFHRVYFAARGAAAARQLEPWLLPLYRLTWLRTTAAFAAFRASHADRVMDARARAIARRAIAAALDPDAVAAARREWTD